MKMNEKKKRRNIYLFDAGCLKVLVRGRSFAGKIYVHYFKFESCMNIKINLKIIYIFFAHTQTLKEGAAINLLFSSVFNFLLLWRNCFIAFVEDQKICKILNC